MTLVKTKQRVADHGEVFTPPWMVQAMLAQVQAETERIDSRFLEPACGSGNFIVPILQRKLAAVDIRYGASGFDRQQYALWALMCLYGIELLADNVAECRANVLHAFASHLALEPTHDLLLACAHVLSHNIVHGNARTMRTHSGQHITFAEWSYLGKGKFQRRDFRLDTLTGAAAFGAADSLFAGIEQHELFTPVKTWPPLTVTELAAGTYDQTPLEGNA